MAKGKESALIRTNWLSIFEELDDAEAGQLIKHYMRFINGLEPVPPNRLIKLVFEPIKIQLEKDLDAWKLTCEKNKSNGVKGGRPPRIFDGEKPTGLFGLNEKPKKPDNDKDNDKEKEDDKKNKKNSDKIARAILSEREKKFYDDLRPFVEKYNSKMIREFYDYWREPNKSKTQMRFEMQKTWDLNLRLANWSKKEKIDGKNYKRFSQPSEDEFLNAIANGVVNAGK